jgi:hypothetical protein
MLLALLAGMALVNQEANTLLIVISLVFMSGKDSNPLF